MDTIDGMRVYAGVVEAGSFAAAARRIGISNALASKYVRQLEERLGVRLLNRTTRSVRPTEIGTAYYGRCVRILSEIDELEESVTSEHARPRGILRVAGPPAFGEDMLADAVASFMQRYPDIVVELFLDERMVDIVSEGFDVALRVSELKDSSMIARRIADYPYLVCASTAYLERAGTPKTPADLAEHACIINTAISPTGQWDFVIDGERRHLAVPVSAKVNTARATAALVRSGRGIGLCLSSTIRSDIETGEVVRLLDSFEAYDRSVYAIYPHSRHLSAKVRAFVEHLLVEFRDQRTR